MTDERRITGEPLPPGLSPTPGVGRLRAQSAHLLGHPVILLIQPDTVAAVTAAGALLAADTTETAVRSAGGQPLTLPTSLSGEPAPGWTASLDTRTGELLVRFPGSPGYLLYDGTMPTVAPWPEDVRRASSVVVITGPMATLADVGPVIQDGRATWIRVPITIT